MRVSHVVAATALAICTPAAVSAQEAVPDQDMMALVERLEDPAEQEKLASMLGAMGEIVLALPVGQMVGPMAEATGKAPSIAPDATVRDLAGPDAEALPGQIEDKVPQMMGMMASLIEGMDAMRPMLKEMSRTMRERIQQGGS